MPARVEVSVSFSASAQRSEVVRRRMGRRSLGDCGLLEKAVEIDDYPILISLR